MSVDNGNSQRPWEAFYGPNLGYAQEQYERYVLDPASVDEATRTMFERWGQPPAAETTVASGSTATAPIDANLLKKAVAAGKLVWNIRTYGHLAADIDPLHIGPAADTGMMEASKYGITEADLAVIPAELVWFNAPAGTGNGADAIRKLKKAYTGTIAYEFSHVHVEAERDWLNDQAEQFAPAFKLSREERKELFTGLVEAESFEDFLHRTFVGQKRFSVEGNESAVPLVNELVKQLADNGAKNILLGMAHRGRLNVLAHVLGKPYKKIFSEFHHSPNRNLVPSEGSMGINYGWSGDVKYHLGANRSLKRSESVETRITLANNPSHLEYVNPVVHGFTRAAQEDRTQPGYPVQDVKSAGTIVMHGDAAFPGEGIVTETLNIGQLKGYTNGGSIHVIVNNKIGFTTESVDSRSTHYSSDPAKGYEIPIIHVNADDPEACLLAARIATEYRSKFQKDFLIDLIGYRRYGHNETDDPETTQPTIYAKVKAHASVSKLYAERLIQEGAFTAEEIEQVRVEVMNKLKDAYEEMKNSAVQEQVHQATDVRAARQIGSIPTGVSLEKLRQINMQLLQWPAQFNVYPKLQRILERRSGALNEGEKVDWSHAETLAFATILAEGKPIRITGQDAERATFAHRNLVLHDSNTGETFCPLHKMPQAKASFAIHNSPLSESAVLGFEYGYNVYSPETFAIWEAQFGDFANTAQVLIDQFISAGRSKWSQKSSLTMLLPHGFEGQGPEHSSARLERFLQMSGEENWTVAYLSSASQYFHLLRRQAAISETEAARPLVLMSPKSLIRNPRVASPAAEFAEGTEFHPILEQPGLGSKPERVERIVFCTGKMAIDLADALEKDENKDKDWLHIVRVEQLYPFPQKEIEAVIARFPNAKQFIWVQEEPQNMGAWSYIEPRLRAVSPEGATVSYIGRPERSSPATGFQDVHAFEQQQIITMTFNQKPTLTYSTGR
ncbi:2-oxoglutarate dehydrogenase E1 component [Paenibacillus sp. MMS18-CY102]|uniref:2-oxoglutarate dehydrogenase E1 component n=1 Tax=Paenibacillus sp. MMS18-CY102 TaxID=2682849 RepID=UPI0013667D73|nr:2-oxoglutarate dehydrogenase E1 component [Paenibacillus sp. MMS18-CY102]MWC26965.1 2-oxoglutarate dehydrogenase E1 component [Paenibacillus sp. MMS18-CY102]